MSQTPASPKTIVHLCYHLGGRGAVEARALFDAREQMAAGHAVTLVTDFVAGPLPDGIDVESGSFSMPGRLPEPMKEFGRLLAVRSALNRLLTRVKPDVIAFHSGSLSWAGIPAARRTGAMAVYVVQALVAERIARGANPYGALRTRFYAAADEYGLKNADRIVAVSRYMGDAAHAYGVDTARIHVVPNVFEGVNLPPESAYPREYDIIYAGRLSAEKGVDVLLDALAGLPAALKVAIVGEGPEATALKAQAGRLPMTVEFLGWLKRPQLFEHMARSKLAVVPSLSEPQGVIVLEALANGTPVIGSNTGGIPEMVIPGKNGWLFPPGDANALRALLTEALGANTHLDDMRSFCRASIEPFTPRAVATLRERAFQR